MKVLLSERSFKGHRKTYMEWLIKIPEIDFYLLAPANLGVEESHFTRIEIPDDFKSLSAYFSWIKQMKYIIKSNNIDVVHILDGDSIMCYFGVGIGMLNAKKIAITYHHFFPGFVRKISYRLMCQGKERTCVVHTQSVYKEFQKLGIKNISRCEYPAFGFDSISRLAPSNCKKKFEIPEDIPTIGLIGGMSAYKNIIPFLEIMKKCTQKFHLLICGKEGEIKEKDIRIAITPYEDKVTLKIARLTNEEYEEAIVASDIIYCIYGHDFDGASGPLTDGVCAEKMILSCKHGSLGEIVSQNLLGLSAECDDDEEILKQTELALMKVKSFKYNEVAKKYRERLKPSKFQAMYKKIYLTL